MLSLLFFFRFHAFACGSVGRSRAAAAAASQREVGSLARDLHDCLAQTVARNLGEARVSVICQKVRINPRL